MCLQNLTSVIEISTHFFVYLRTLLLPKNGQGSTDGFANCTNKSKDFSLLYFPPCHKDIWKMMELFHPHFISLTEICGQFDAYAHYHL
jgi:hypothetical protein